MLYNSTIQNMYEYSSLYPSNLMYGNYFFKEFNLLNPYIKLMMYTLGVFYNYLTFINIGFMHYMFTLRDSV